MSIYKEPVKHTCPDIDYVIDSVKAAISYIDSKSSTETYTYEERCEDAKNALIYLEDYMEEIRSANSALRDWGNNLTTLAEDLEDQVSDLQKQIDNQ